ncbi:MAG: serine/threonine-protein kinase [Myxococcota bacterium]
MVAIQCPAKVGRYVLLRHLQSGGMADLYAAKVSGVENFERLVAIKIVRPPGGGDEESMGEFIDMFVDEARLAGQLTHANIAQIYELGRFRQQLYIAMELVEGHNITEIMNRLKASGQTAPLPFAAYVVSQAALGLDYAHRREDLQGRPLNLVHRDVSPHNILMSYEGEVKVIDFGVAKAEMRRTETSGGMLKGKIGYMAPEQLRTRQVDRRADIFALGSCLYEMLAGRRLYQGSDTLDLLERVRNADLPVLEETLPQMPSELILVLRSALAPDPENRFQQAADLAKALEPFLIYNRSIYGASEASEVIRAVYPNTPNRRRDYVNVSDEEIADLGREFDPSVVEAFDKVAAGRSRTPAPEPEDHLWVKATTEEYRSAVSSEHRPARIHAPEAQPEKDPNYVEPEDASDIHAAFDGSPPTPRSKVPMIAAAAAAVVALVALGAYVALQPSETPSDDAEPAIVAEPAEKTAEVGYLSVSTKSGSQLTVLVNGERVGKTPVELHPLPYGQHTLQVVFRQKGKRTESRPQVIQVGENNTDSSPLKVVINDGAAKP